MFSRAIQSTRGFLRHFSDSANTVDQIPTRSQTQAEVTDSSIVDMVSTRTTMDEEGGVRSLSGASQKSSHGQPAKRKRLSADRDELEENAKKKSQATSDRNSLDPAMLGPWKVDRGAIATDEDLVDKAQILPLRPHEISETEAAVGTSESGKESSSNFSFVSTSILAGSTHQEATVEKAKASSILDKQNPLPLLSLRSLASTKPTHRRFSNDGPFVPETQWEGQKNSESIREHSIPKEENERYGESDDDAPETMSAAAGQGHARTAAEVIANAAQRQAQAKKDYRRRRDATFKDQSQTARMRKRTQDIAQAERDHPGTSTRADAESQARIILKSGVLPALLPAEILAFEPPTRSPTVLPEQTLTTSHTNKRKVFDVDPKPPKDVKRGSRIFRVLEKQHKILAPKASKSSKNIRESWLSGRGAGSFKGNNNERVLRKSFTRR